MPQRTAKKTLYLNADRTKLVDADDPAARFLLVREGSAVNESEVKRLEKAGVSLKALTTEGVEAYDARADHEARHAGDPGPVSDDAEAEVRRQRGTKAVTAAPENK
jgi:hypothetical protein